MDDNRKIMSNTCEGEERMEPVSVCLIEKNYLLREGLKALLAETNFKITATYHNIEEAGHDKGNDEQNAVLVICGIDEFKNNPGEFLNRLKRNHPLSRIAVISSAADSKLITACFSEGVDGYLSRNLSSISLLNALNMIMSGEKVYPAEALDFLIKNNGNANQGERRKLSDREMEILRHVAHGKTNKQIALHRDIAESTVKAHVKTILRKLALSNRTQAARWAFSEGLTEEMKQESIRAVNENRP